MKKFFAVIAASIMIVALAPQAHSNEIPKTIVIIDTGIDTSYTQLSGAIIHQVCLAISGCATTEGANAATVVAKSGFEHGTMMALVANSINPSAKIIPIRIWQSTRSGSISRMTETEFTNAMTRALDWVIQNKSKYNIVSVSASMGGSAGYRSGSNYCPIKATHSAMISNIEKLASVGVPTIFASGNDGDTKRINFPSCISQSVAVSAVNTTQLSNAILIEANSSSEVDFYALGVYSVGGKNVRGTSASAAAFSAYWAKNYKGSFQSTYDYMKSISTSTKNSRISTTLFVDVLK